MEKKRSIINIFDILVIIAAFGIAAALFLMRGDRQTEDTREAIPTKEINWSVEFVDVPENVAGMIAAGDTLYDNETGAKLGTVTSVAVGENLKKTKVSATGEVKFTAVPDTKSVLVGLKASVSESERDIKADGIVNIRVGKAVIARGPGYICGGNVVIIERGE